MQEAYQSMGAKMGLGGFNWRVAEAGYKWETPPPPWDGGPILVVEQPWPSREYQPLVAHSGLFRAFAELVPEPEPILAFAAEYGHLGEFVWVSGTAFDINQVEAAGSLNESLTSRVAGGARVAGLERPETLAFWQSQIGSMKTTVALWDRILAKKTEPNETSKVAEAIEIGCRGRFETRPCYDSKTQRLEWLMRPCDLLGGMWMQQCVAVEHDTVHRRCLVCGKWFGLSPRAVRGDKHYCSPECRHKAYRNRKSRACELHAKGVSVVEIAKLLESDVKTVEGWLKNAKPADGGNGGGQEGKGRITDYSPPENQRALDL